MIKNLLARQEEERTFEELQNRISRLNACLQVRSIEREGEVKLQGVSLLKTEMKPSFNAKPVFVPVA